MVYTVVKIKVNGIYNRNIVKLELYKNLKRNHVVKHGIK
jgi:hypothetical protein